jgi:membrane associated rhomboid family serine protease
MRQLRELADQPSAQRLCDALLERGIEAEPIETQRGSFGVWVVDESKLKQAQALSERWLERDADDLELAAQRGRARRELSARIEDRRERARKALAERTEQVRQPPHTPLTWGLIALCVGVFLLTNVGDLVSWLQTTWLGPYRPELGANLPDARHVIGSLLILDLQQQVVTEHVSLLGLQLDWLPLSWHQPWRLVTPMLLHFNLLHVLFNLLWLGILGALIELHHGTRQLAAFTLLASALPNILQLEMAQNPMFGGMSGVVYGLFGLVWMRARLDPGVGYVLSRGSVQFMLIWLGLGFLGEFARVVGLTQIVGIANWCHLGGLLLGMAWGALGARLARRR